MSPTRRVYRLLISGARRIFVTTIRRSRFQTLSVNTGGHSSPVHCGCGGWPATATSHVPARVRLRGGVCSPLATHVMLCATASPWLLLPEPLARPSPMPLPSAPFTLLCSLRRCTHELILITGGALSLSSLGSRPCAQCGYSGP